MIAGGSIPTSSSVVMGPGEVANPQPSVEPILQFFAWNHLPAHLQVVSRPFSRLAHDPVAELPRNPERTVALRKLLEAKDAAVRAVIAVIAV